MGITLHKLHLATLKQNLQFIFIKFNISNQMGWGYMALQESPIFPVFKELILLLLGSSSNGVGLHGLCRNPLSYPCSKDLSFYYWVLFGLFFLFVCFLFLFVCFFF